MYISEEEARLHNITLRVLKKYTCEKVIKGLTKEELEQDLFLRKKDFRFIKDELFIEKCNKYIATNKLIKELSRLNNKKNSNQDLLEGLEKEYIELFEEMRTNKNYIPTCKIRKLAANIHWIKLPEYEEYMIVNREIFPNEDTEEYYDHYHALEDLYYEIQGKGKKIESIKGDVNIDQEVEVKIYSRRWGHDDVYSIIRTIDGWDVSFFQHTKGGKEGDALISTLNHDYINYPSALEQFMYNLWNRADREEMSIEVLKAHLERIAEWINVCEKNTPEGIEE